MARTITLKTTSAAHKEAVRLVADALNARSYANRSCGEGLATPGMRAAFDAQITRKMKAAQPSLKAARAEDRAAKEASRDASMAHITARFQSFWEGYSYLTKGQIAVIHAHEGWAGR